MIEREMQDLLWKYSAKFFNEQLKQFAWEMSSEVGRADIVFEDQYGRLLIVEVKRGKLPREAIGQLLDYFGMMKQRYPDKSVEMMVVAWTIPSERRLTCEQRDIECREISEKTFRDVAAEVGYVFASEAAQSSQSIGVSLPAQVPRASVEQKHESGSNWSFNKSAQSLGDEQEFLSRCDEKGKQFFSALFSMQRAASNHTKITWKHESGFSLRFYFHGVGFAPMVWGYPARNRDGRHIVQRLLFPFDRSLKAGVSESFVNDFGSSVAALVPISGGGKQVSISVAALSSDESKQVLETIFRFVEKAAKK
jgi:Endonuclease NucS